VISARCSSDTCSPAPTTHSYGEQRGMPHRVRACM
jgi:hypothetical protein